MKKVVHIGGEQMKKNYIGIASTFHDSAIAVVNEFN